MASKMSSLMDLVSQNQPHFQTHQALLVIGLQNDFVLPDGRLPVNVKKGFLERIQALIPKFRELNGNVIWVQTLYEADRIGQDANTGEGDALVLGGLIDGEESGNEGGDEELAKEASLLPAQSRSSKHKQRALDLLKRVSARRKAIPKEVAIASAEEDDELFLLKSEKKVPACVPHTHGAEFADVIARQFELPADMVIRTTNYSAFQGTNLLMTLRARLVTELYICGCITNISVLATVIDAARHGVKINVIEDCLGYRKRTRHDLALKRMEEFFDAYLINSEEIIAREPTATTKKPSTLSNGTRTISKGDKTIEASMGSMSLGDDGRPASRTSNPKSPTRVLSGKQRTLSLVAAASSQQITQDISESVAKPPVEQSAEPSDKQFADMLVQGATLSGAQQSPPEKEKPNLVKTKIRMRSKPRKKQKEKEGEASKTGGESEHAKAESSTSVRHGTNTSTPPNIITSTIKPAQTPADAQRTSLVAKAGSVADLREKESKHQSLKNAASVPVLSAKAGSDDKERNKLSDFSDRVRLSLSRAPKSESGSESKRGSVSSFTKASSITSKPEDRVTEEVHVNPAELITTPRPEESTPKETGNQAPARVSPTPEAPVKMAKPSKLQSLANLPVLGPGDHIAEGDSRIINDFFPVDLHHPTDTSKPLRDLIFTQLYNEVRWQKMLHQQGEVPRLVCCQGAFGEDGSMPVYRHPTDQTLPLLTFSPKVQVIRKQAEKLVGHPLNHVLIQLYRSGNDFISEHSDKTLDIVKGSSIVNVSFGSQRTMRLRTKKASSTAGPDSTPPAEDTPANQQRETQRIAMPHNSMFVLGLKSNEKWLHGIMPDKRLPFERSEAENSFNGIRISLTFRHIGTFLDGRESVIWGQGATAKQHRDAADVINGDEKEAQRMICAFSRENHHPVFDWEEWYGHGFDVLHLHAPPPQDFPILFASNNKIETRQVMIALAEAKIPYTLLEAPELETVLQYKGDRQISFRDNDSHHTEVSMSSSILLYLDRFYPLDTSPLANTVTAQAYPTMMLAARILKAWANRAVPTTFSDTLNNTLATLEEQLQITGAPFIAGSRFSTADCFTWPILDELISQWTDWDAQVYPALAEWYKGVWRKKASIKRIREVLPQYGKEKGTESKD
ncbi:hypothetical protein EJ02DRAFT_459668 [Clathrospora elynae]|uniref:Fe2OG dioxygenase domain-containing protein n=1 Tax=Clathrospora elynae TaxID=706981 RepID=A0A6A5S9Y9_9PLEO|nr:hypothetical protein EJ02DRAFT_459668 [Clathrospora elynae]